jgi:hypothetical protein
MPSMKKVVLFLWIGVSVSPVFFSGCRQREMGTDHLLHTGQTLLNLQKAETERLRQSLGYLQDIVSKQGNRPADSLLVMKASALQAAASQSLSRIDTLEARLVSEAGGRDSKTKAMLHPGNYQSVRKWQASHYNQDALAGHLNGLAGQIAALAPATTKDTTAFMRSAEQTLQLLADGKISAGAGVALLTALRIDIARFSAEAVQSISHRLQRLHALATDLRPIVRQSPGGVREGDTCTVEVHLAEYLTFAGKKQPVMYAEGKSIPVEGGMGKVSFIVRPPFGRRTWKGKVHCLTPWGREAPYDVQEVYYVVPQ